MLSEFDPALLVRWVAAGPSPPVREVVVQRISAAAALLVVIAEQLLDKFAGPDLLDAYSGWDPAPDSTTPRSDLASGHTLTLIFSLPDVGDVTPKLALTMTGVPPEHSGPGLFLSVGGSGAFEKTIDRTTLTIEAGAASALDMFIPFSKDAHDFELGSGAAGFLKVSLLHSGNNEPAVRIGEAGKTRLDIGKIGFGVDLSADRAGVRLFMKDAELVINLGEGDGFLQQLPAGELKLSFNIGFWPIRRRLPHRRRRQRATIPVEKSLGGILNIHSIDLALGAGSAGCDAALEMATSLVDLRTFPGQRGSDWLQVRVRLPRGQSRLHGCRAGLRPPTASAWCWTWASCGAATCSSITSAAICRGAGAERSARGASRPSACSRQMRWQPRLGVAAAHLRRIALSHRLRHLLRQHRRHDRLHHSVDITALQEDMPKGAFDDILFPADPSPTRAHHQPPASSSPSSATRSSSA